tara:strand:- start:577 stop:717 length:141 start_codon:yes stop_codon:yes gene_type:complete
MNRFIFVWVLALLSLYISFMWFRVVGMAYKPKNISPENILTTSDLI